jgi:hypothetical protein
MIQLPLLFLLIQMTSCFDMLLWLIYVVKLKWVIVKENKTKEMMV